MSILLPQSGKPQWYNNKGARKRSTYTQTNADLFKDFFNALLASDEEKMLPYAAFTVKEQTLHVKVCDALKFLTDNSESVEERLKYLIVKDKYRIVPDVNGIYFRFRESYLKEQALKKLIADGGISSKAGEALLIADAEEQGWKKQVLEFISPDNYIPALEIILPEAPTTGDKQWVVDRFNGLHNMDFMFLGTKTLKMIKEKE